MLQICDIEVNAQFKKNHVKDSGTYSHSSNGSNNIDHILGIFATDSGQRGSSFTFEAGDKVELQWDGPKRKFTTMMLSTGETYYYIIFGQL